jgi:hypothetical protein
MDLTASNRCLCENIYIYIVQKTFHAPPTNPVFQNKHNPSSQKYKRLPDFVERGRRTSEFELPEEGGDFVSSLG